MASSKKDIEQQALGGIIIAIVAAFILSKLLGLGFWAGAAIAVIIFLILAYFADKEEQNLIEYEDGKDCSFCGERVKKAAIKCKHCQSNLA